MISWNSKQNKIRNELTWVFPSIANCSSDSYYNTQKDACDKCAIGTYQPGQGQKECLSCGENLTTLLKGMEKELDCIGKLSIY